MIIKKRFINSSKTCFFLFQLLFINKVMVIKHIYKNDNKPAITVRRENALANFLIDWRLMNIYV